MSYQEFCHIFDSSSDAFLPKLQNCESTGGRKLLSSLFSWADAESAWVSACPEQNEVFLSKVPCCRAVSWVYKSKSALSKSNGGFVFIKVTAETRRVWGVPSNTGLFSQHCSVCSVPSRDRIMIGYCDSIGEWQKCHNKRFVKIQYPNIQNLLQYFWINRCILLLSH